MDAKHLIAQAEKRLLAESHVSLREANANQLHNALSGAVMEAISPLWVKKETERAAHRQAFYLSAEFLVGRLIYNNLYCLGVLEDVRKLLAEKGVDIALMEDVEDDAFGNGGLGRLAACFLDSAVTCDVPLTGYGLRYRYGLFKQTIVNGRQAEEPDDWARFGDPWSIRREDLAVTVHMKTGDVLAVPYDMPVIGFGGKNIGTLRLWQCESLHEIDFPLFNQQEYQKASADKNKAEDITKFLYPNDTLRAGKQMRVKQQYVLVSATMQDLLRAYKARHGQDFSHLAEETAAQLNDTHPTMAIPELIRLLMAEGMKFNEAFDICFNVFAYTNHTVMQEALEKWDLDLLRSVCPEIVRVMRRIDARFQKDAAKMGKTPGDHFCVIRDGRVHMAQLAVYATHATNGVAELHSRILRDDLFKEWYECYPERFRNKTNGITQRRWLGLCNPELCALIEKYIGSGFVTDLDKLAELKPLIDGPQGDEIAREFAAVKRVKKEQLADAIRKATGVELSPDMIFDVIAKRLHEYKRQLLDALSILAIYQEMKAGRLTDFTPTAYLFAAKAAPGYDRAKSIIYLIHQIADLVNNDPETNDRLKVVFIPNYNCSWAEKIMPAADVSEQISTAGTEASGTGNMKLSLNGAVTLGTWDGANIEIVEQAGRENNYIFGATVEELNAIRATYDPKKIYKKNAVLRRALDALTDGTFPEDAGLRELHDAILEGASWHQPDHYFLLQDFDSYLNAKLQVNRDWRDREAFSKKCLRNLASCGKFSSDRTIREYAAEIWNV